MASDDWVPPTRRARFRDQPPQLIRHGRLRKSRPLVEAVKFAGIAIAVIAVSATSITAFAIGSTLSNIKPGVHLGHLTGTQDLPAPQIGAIDGSVNLLLAGTDSRLNQKGFQDRADLQASSGAGNNDVTMVLHISADHQHATVVSIPRDLLVTFPDCPRTSGGGYYPGSTMTMFNTGLSRGGLNCVVLAAEKLTGLNIQYAAEISFDGVIAMSNAVGGVSVCLATPVKDIYTGLNLAAGQQTLVGSQALAFVRSRHGVGDGSDIGRISNQQLFLSALMRKITGAGVLSNPLTLYALANAAVKNMVFSDTLSYPSTMVAIAVALKNVSLNNMVFVQFPSTSNPAYPGRVVPLEADDVTLVAALDHDRPVVLTGTVGRAVTAPSGVSPASAPSPSASPLAKSSAKSSTKSPATPVPSSTPTHQVPSVALPSAVTGQTAAQQTCTRGFYN